MSRIHMPRRGLGIALIGGTSLALVLLQTAAFAATLGDAYVGTSGSAHGTTVGVQVAGQDVAQVGSTKASSRDDGSKSDATVLSVGGQEIAGAHASSGQGQGSDSSSTGYLQETCDQSGGQACVSVLFGRATTSDDGSSSTGSADSAIAKACLGGTQRRPSDKCDGQVEARALESHSRSRADRTNGRGSASESSDLAALCLGGTTADGTCGGFGLILLFATSSARADPNGRQASGGSYIAAVDAGGQRTVAGGDPQQVDVPPGCPAGGSLICLALNRGGTDAGADSASGDRETAGIDILSGALNGDDGGNGDLSDVGVSTTAGTPVKVKAVHHHRQNAGGGPSSNGTRILGATGGGNTAAGTLPFTGFDATVALLAAAALVAAGAGLWGLGYRRFSADG